MRAQSGAFCCMCAVTSGARCPTTTTVATSGIDSSECTTCSSIDLPHTSCNGFGRSDFMREPSPAARMIAQTPSEGIGVAVTSWLDCLSFVPGRGLEPLFTGSKPVVLPLNDPGPCAIRYRDFCFRHCPDRFICLMSSLIKKRRKRMRKKKHKKMLRRTRHQRRK